MVVTLGPYSRSYGIINSDLDQVVKPNQVRINIETDYLRFTYSWYKDVDPPVVASVSILTCLFVMITILYDFHYHS